MAGSRRRRRRRPDRRLRIVTWSRTRTTMSRLRQDVRRGALWRRPRGDPRRGRSPGRRIGGRPRAARAARPALPDRRPRLRRRDAAAVSDRRRARRARHRLLAGADRARAPGARPARRSAWARSSTPTCRAAAATRSWPWARCSATRSTRATTRARSTHGAHRCAPPRGRVRAVCGCGSPPSLAGPGRVHGRRGPLRAGHAAARDLRAATARRRPARGVATATPYSALMIDAADRDAGDRARGRSRRSTEELRRGCGSERPADELPRVDGGRGVPAPLRLR